MKQKTLGATRKLGIQKNLLSEKGYVERFIELFDMKMDKFIVPPLTLHFKLSSKQYPTIAEDEAYMENVPYASAVGSIMYAMVSKRPCIPQAI